MDKFPYSIYSKKNTEMKKSEVFNRMNYYQQVINTIIEEKQEKKFEFEIGKMKNYKRNMKMNILNMGRN
jgi:hypothetical protein